MNCTVENCSKPGKARNFCNTHYHAWWVLQPKENRSYVKGGRPRKNVVSYGGMHSRLEINKSSASTHECIDCGNTANDWTWNNTCPDVLYGVAKKGRPSLNPYCLHLEHYEARCTPCHMVFDKSLA
jgi:hypothetical protein